MHQTILITALDVLTLFEWLPSLKFGIVSSSLLQLSLEGKTAEPPDSELIDNFKISSSSSLGNMQSSLLSLSVMPSIMKE